MMDIQAILPRADNNPASPPEPPPSNRCKLILLRCIPYLIPTILGLLMVIFLGIPALMPPEFQLNPGSSLSSLNISTSLVTAQWNIALSVKNPSKLIPVEYSRMKLRLSFDGRLALSRPSLIPTFTQGPGNVTTVRARALSMLKTVNDLDVKGLVSSLKSGLVAVDVVVRAKRRLHLGPWGVPVFHAYASCMDVTFMAPADGEDSGDWMILGGTPSCTLDIFTLLWTLSFSSNMLISGEDKKEMSRSALSTFRAKRLTVAVIREVVKRRR